jgi:hypothetical protein
MQLGLLGRETGARPGSRCACPGVMRAPGPGSWPCSADDAVFLGVRAVWSSPPARVSRYPPLSHVEWRDIFSRFGSCDPGLVCSKGMAWAPRI